MVCLDWLDTAQGVIALASGLLSLIGAFVATFFAIKNFIKATKEKSAKEIWNMVMNMADAAMTEVEKQERDGATKKTMAIEAVKASCKAAGIDLDPFLDQLSAYIDQAISFANSLKK